MKIKKLLGIGSKNTPTKLSKLQLKFLKDNKITEYTVLDDLSIDVVNNVYITTTQEKLPVQFNKVEGNFYCQDSGLTTLKGCPKYTKSFSCAGSTLKSLIGGPEEVQDSYNITESSIESLEGFPKKVRGNIVLRDNKKLTSLKGCVEIAHNEFNVNDCEKLQSFEFGPKKIKATLHASYCKIQSFKHFPSEINGSCYLRGNEIEDMEGVPSIINGALNLIGNPIKSITGIEKQIKEVKSISFNDIDYPILSILLIDKIDSVSFGNSEIDNIINPNLNKGRRGLLAAQTELLSSGFDDLAKR